MGLVVVHNGPDTQLNWDTMGLVRNGTGTQMSMELGHNRPGMGLAHNGTGTQQAWDTMGLVHNGTGTQLAWDTMGLIHNGTMTHQA